MAAAYLVPGAIALGMVMISLAAGAADVISTKSSRLVRAVAIFASCSLATVGWAALIVWISSHVRSSDTTMQAAALTMTVCVAAGPPVAFALETARSGEVSIDVTAAVGLSAVVAIAAVLASVAKLVAG